MAKVLFKAIMGIHSVIAYISVIKLANAVCDALEKNVSIYTNPEPTIAAIKAQIAILLSYISKVDNGDHSFIPLRNEASIALYQMLQYGLIYVNKIANGDRGIATLSGYPVSSEHDQRPAPDKVDINRIVNGVHPNTAKIFIHISSPSPLTYKVQSSTTPDIETSWKTVLVTANKNKLVIPNMIRGQEIHFRVNASNAAGDGLWSDPLKFFSR